MAPTSTSLVGWLRHDQLQPSPSPLVLDWLFNPDSLTTRLTRQADGAFSVRPLFEGWQSLRDDECEVLGIAPGSEGWVRDVYLCGRGQPWVFARSVASRQALLEDGFPLDQLGERSLGLWLFNDNSFARGEFSVTHYPENYLPEAARTPDLWARRSSFTRGALAVLVAEIFLPEFWAQFPAQSSTL